MQHEDKKYRITHVDDICYNPANLKFGVICRNKYKDAIFSLIYVTFRVCEDASPKFIEHYVRRESFIISALAKQEGTVYERMAVKPADLLDINILIPTKAEQRKIGDFLSSFDHLINFHREKVEKLKQLKESFLDKMFVSM